MVTVTRETPVGPVTGRRDGPVAHFAGVPYADAPRWGLPRSRQWTDPYDATGVGVSPPQVVGGLDLVPGMVPGSTHEDCLRAEIWTPDVEGSAPVIVWVPGGSFRVGGAALETYGGAHLAARGAVVVGLSYRLGALGWLAADGVPPNLGLHDVRTGLDWVRRVVPAFGGDPARIVVMGESAGAGLLAHLLAGPSELGIRGAILQSGAPAGTLSAEVTHAVGTQFLASLGVARAEDALALPVAQILDAQESTVAALAATVGMMPFHPWIDADLVSATPAAGLRADVALVVGTTAHEMELFRAQVPQLPAATAARFLARKGQALGVDEQRAAAGLAAAGGDLVEAVADLELHLPNEQMARAHEARGLPVYRYRFGWEAPQRRACHALDLPFSFGTLDVAGWRAFAGADGARAAAADVLSARMQEAWVSFAASGRPACAPVGPWPTDDLVQLGHDITVGPDRITHRLPAWG